VISENEKTMKRNEEKRSSMTINAVAQAAAQGALPALATGRKITAVAALAGFVLRMFRQKLTPASVTPRACRRPRRAVRALPARKGGLNHG
jgi:hypothetical protein